LTKADLCDDPDPFLRAAGSAAAGTLVFAISCITGQGVKALAESLGKVGTAVLLGSSGVGKSTLINWLMGDEWQAVVPVRETDGKGRHTTTRRELFVLPTGGLLIDTPGLRELQLWDGAEGVEDAFADIEELATGCRFTNCRHETEPDCVIRAAVEAGKLDAARVASMQKLQREIAHFERRHDPRALAEERMKIKAIHQQLRAHPKYRR
jgi:ribosome biogenesis GTPase